jgi:streptogramin lyase
MIRIATLAILVVMVSAACSSGGTQGVASPSPGFRVLATIKVGEGASTPAVGEGFVWVPNSNDGTLSKINPKDNRVVATIPIGDTQVLLAAGCGDRSVHQYPPLSWAVRRCNLPSAVAVGAGSVWVTKNDTHSLLRLDPKDAHVVADIPLGIDEFDLAVGPESVWVTDYENRALARVDIATNRLLSVTREVGKGPTSVLAIGGSVWVVLSREDAVLRLDAKTGQAVTKISVPVPETAHLGGRPLPIAAVGDSIWVRNEYYNSLTRIDLGHDQVIGTLDIGAFTGRDGMDHMAVVGSSLWVSGIQLQRIDPSRNQVVQKLPYTGISLTYGEGSLWVVDIFGTVSRLSVSAS